MSITYLITITAALVVVIRLLTFRRRDGRYRPGIALAAWLMVVATTCAAIFGPAPSDLARWLIALTLVALAAGLLRTGGNVAHLVRPLRRL